MPTAQPIIKFTGINYTVGCKGFNKTREGKLVFGFVLAEGFRFFFNSCMTSGLHVSSCQTNAFSHKPTDTLLFLCSCFSEVYKVLFCPWNLFGFLTLSVLNLCGLGRFSSCLSSLTCFELITAAASSQSITLKVYFQLWLGCFLIDRCLCPYPCVFMPNKSWYFVGI